MRFGRILCSTTVLLALSVSGIAMSHSRRGPTSQKSYRHGTKASHRASQRAIDDNRATEIQEALVKQGYLTESSGHWDAETEAAMQKLQADNGWQTKLIPDSRAIIKLGLGPNHDDDQATLETTEANAQ